MPESEDVGRINEGVGQDRAALEQTCEDIGQTQEGVGQTSDCVGQVKEGAGEICWFAMRDLTRPNAKLPAYKLLAEKGVEVFTPMKEQLKIERGRRIKEDVPILHDLLFVHGLREALDPIVDKTETLQYRFKRGVQHTPITVEEKEMRRFILAVRTSKQPKYYLPGELTSEMYGRQVRIIGGPLDAFDGKLLKLRGSRKKYLIVELKGLLSVGVEVSPEYITIL